ncbi:MAG TPA: hypothetical protein VFC04_02705 [Actinomycetota bacterium]|nr:hypothetical protein [Actinomycetota bacterium]
MIASDVRKFMEAALEKLTPAKAQEIARSVLKGEGRDQVQRLAKELMDWSTRNRERVVDLVQREVKAQLKLVGVASRDEVEALRKRVRELERIVPKGVGAKRPAARKRASAKRTARSAPASQAT